MRQLRLGTLPLLWIIGLVFSVHVSAQTESGTAPATEGAATAPGSGLEEVTVSSSRIDIAGYQAPTPVSVIGLQQLQTDARTDLSDVIDKLPQFGPGIGPSIMQDNITNGSEGLDLVNLRNLGTSRTLVLFDGQRVVQAYFTGGVDLSEVPQALVERVDVVTGGASAAWGSDAVAGVINLVINKNFNGVRVDVEDSDNWKNQHPQRKVDLTLGTGFDDNRGHIEFGGTYLSEPKPFFSDETEGFAEQRLMPDPICPTGYLTNTCAGGPIYVHASGVSDYNATPGGIITGTYNAAGKLTNTQATGGTLINTYFEGPNATPLIFNKGITEAGAWSWGGTQNFTNSDLDEDAIPLTKYNGLLLASFQITDKVKASLQYDYSWDQVENNSYSDDHYANLKIYSGNPFIPASVQATMNANGISALQMGTENTNPITGVNNDLNSEIDTVGIPVVVADREFNRFVASFDGSFGQNWIWNTYFDHGESYNHIFTLNIVDEAAFANAINAVTVGNYTQVYTAAAYPNPLGLPVGSTTCLSNLLPVGAKGETSNCAPLNIFGSGPGIASQAAINYIQADSRAGLDTHEQTNTENAAEASLHGQLPFGLPAGQVAAALGFDYRREESVDVSTYQAAVLKEFQFGDFPYFWGSYSTKEGFAEVNAPILKDQVLKSLSFDAAYRGTDYSTSGFVQTYKFGVVSDLTNMLRLRASYSYDIRAPQLNQLFNQGTPVGETENDFRNGVSVNIFNIAEGNPKLKPEDSETRTMGLVFTPVTGLSASIDWWYIRMKGLIASPSLGLILSQCAAGNSVYCQFVQFNGPIGPKGLPELSAVLSIPGNLNWLTESGIDFSLDYRIAVGPGAFGFNIQGTDVWEGRENNLGTLSDCFGSVGVNAQPCGLSGVPKFHANMNETYTQGPWLYAVAERWWGEWVLNSTWQDGVNIDDNEIPAYIYFDLRGSYQINGHFQVYAAIDNALDKKPPLVFTGTGTTSGGNGTSTYETPFDNALYDTFGRVWRVGVRAKF